MNIRKYFTRKWWQDWWEGYYYEEKNEDEVPTEDAPSPIVIEAERIKNRSEQAKKMRAHAKPLVTGDRDALLTTLKECLETSRASALELKRKIDAREIDPLKLYNAVIGVKGRAKMSEDEGTVIRRLYAMRLSVVIETHLGMLDAYRDTSNMSPSQMAEIVGLRQNILHDLLKLEETFGTFRTLQDAIDEARAVVGPLPKPVEPTKGNLMSGRRFGR